MLRGSFALGFWRLLEAKLSIPQLDDLVNSAVDSGIIIMDHADVYGQYQCEEIFGKVLKNNPSLRPKIQLVSKCGIKFNCPTTPQYAIKHYDLSAKSITASVNNSLKNLGTEYLDVLLIHRPSPLMNADEIGETLTQLRLEGKVRTFGVSNFTPSQFALLESRVHLITNQVQFSPLYNQPFYDGTLDQLQENHLRPMAWSPLAGGRLFYPTTDKEVAMAGLLTELAAKYNAKIEQIALAWILKHPTQIIPILGTQNVARIKDAAAATQVDLEVEDWFKVLEVANGSRVP